MAAPARCFRNVRAQTAPAAERERAEREAQRKAQQAQAQQRKAQREAQRKARREAQCEAQLDSLCMGPDGNGNCSH